MASLAGQDLVIDFTVGDAEDSAVNSAVILSSVGFGIAPPVVYVPPSLVNANVTILAPCSSPMVVQASVAINGKQFSSTFYESAVPQYGMLPNETYGYLGNYRSFFGAVSGCQQGHTIAISISYNGVTQSQTGICPPIFKSTTQLHNYKPDLTQQFDSGALRRFLPFVYQSPQKDDAKGKTTYGAVNS